MEFVNLHRETPCDCLETATVNCVDTFARRAFGSGKKFNAAAFRISKRAATADFSDCLTHCATHSISVHIWNDSSQRHVIETLKTSLMQAPESRAKLFIFKVKENGGYVKYTPIYAEVNDLYHYDYYKPDSFEVDCVSCLHLEQTIEIDKGNV